MRVVIAGGTGFLGTHLCREAARRGFEVVSLSQSPPVPSRHVPGIEYKYLDLGSETPVLAGEPDLIINAAGYVSHPSDELGERTLSEQHLSVVRHLLQITPATGARFIHLGSGDEYDDPGLHIDETASAQGQGAYGRAKAMSSELARALSAQSGYGFTLLRLFLTYGPLQAENRLIPQLITGLLADQRVPLTAGTQIRDFLFVSDFVDAVFTCALEPKTIDQTLNVASGTPHSVAELAHFVHQLIGRGQLGLRDLPETRQQPLELVGDPGLLSALTDWEPRTDLHDGLSRTIDYFRQLLR